MAPLFSVLPPAATNRTSAAILAGLVAPQATNNLNHGVNSYEQFRATINGTLFTWNSGAVKVAAGVEQFNSQLYNYILNPQNAGPSSVSSNFQAFNFGRRPPTTASPPQGCASATRA